MSAIDSQLPSSSGQDRPTDEVDRILSPGKLIILGLQHVLVMYAGAVAVPLMIGDRLGLSKEAIAMLISSDLFCCGIVTLLQCIGIGRFMGIRLQVTTKRCSTMKITSPHWNMAYRRQQVWELVSTVW